MINILNVVTALISLVNDHFKTELTPTSELEKKLAQNLFNIVCQVVNNCEIVNEETLVLDKKYTPKEISEECLTSSQPLSQGASRQSSLATIIRRLQCLMRFG